jgi:hypothetical protein
VLIPPEDTEMTAFFENLKTVFAEAGALEE